jgi:hypothetical protein
MKDGKKYFTRVEYCKWDPENPLTWDELIEKFNDLSSGVITKVRRLIQINPSYSNQVIPT